MLEAAFRIPFFPDGNFLTPSTLHFLFDEEELFVTFLTFCP